MHVLKNIELEEYNIIMVRYLIYGTPGPVKGGYSTVF